MPHPPVTFEHRGSWIILVRGDEAGNQIGDGPADHAGLTERGEHLVNVVQEAGTRADDQHAGILQPAAMRVQQVCRTVERDSGFAGSRAALDDDDPIEWRADDTVLFGLDGGDDVGHFAGALRIEGGEQCAFPGERAGILCFADLIGVDVKHFVFDAGDFPEMQGDMATHDDIAVMRRGRFVERPGGFGSPISQDRLMFGAGQADAADVSAFAVNVIETAEHEPILNGAQLHQTVFVHGCEGIAFSALRRRAM